MLFATLREKIGAIRKAKLWNVLKIFQRDLTNEQYHDSETYPHLARQT